MGDIHHTIIDVVTEVVFVTSILHTLLPPWDAFGDFPKWQKRYKVFVYIIGYLALNGRSTVYQKISLDKQVEAAENKITTRAATVGNPTNENK